MTLRAHRSDAAARPLFTDIRFEITVASTGGSTRTVVSRVTIRGQDPRRASTPIDSKELERLGAMQLIEQPLPANDEAQITRLLVGRKEDRSDVDSDVLWIGDVLNRRPRSGDEPRRIVLNLDQDLVSIPWEAALLARWPGIASAPIVREGPDTGVRRSRQHSTPPRFGHIEALTTRELDADDGALRALIQTISRDPWRAISGDLPFLTRPLEEHVDVVHFTGHADSDNPGLRVFQDVDSPVRVPLHPEVLKNFLDDNGVSTLVLAACGTDSPDQSSLTQRLFTGSAVGAIVAMRNVVTHAVAGRFFTEFYEQLLTRRKPLEIAFAEARRALAPPLQGLPQLYLRPEANTVLFPPVEEKERAATPAPPPRALPVGAIRASGALWQVGSADGRLELYEHDEIATVEEGSSLAIAADARAAVAVRNDLVDAAWVVRAGTELDLVRPGWLAALAEDDTLPLPASLRDQEAAVLAVSVLRGSSFRLIIGAEAGTWSVVLSATGWGDPRLLTSARSDAAADTSPTPTLARAGSALSGAAARAFGRTPRAQSFDLAHGNGDRVAVAVSSGRKNEVVAAVERHGRWSRLDLPAVEGSIVGAGVVRRIDATGASPEVLVVTAEDGELLVHRLEARASRGTRGATGPIR